MQELSASDARRIALTAQGFNAAARNGTSGPSQMLKGINRLGVLQIDSVNVLIRAHYLPLFSRLGNYDKDALDALVTRQPKRLFEYWGHEASLLPIDCHPLLRWRMERARQGKGLWTRLEPFAGERRAEADAMLARIASDGPLAASDVAGTKAAKGMWVWSEAKLALEWLFWAGLVAATHRRGSFERVYDLPDRVLPRATIAAPTPDAADAQRTLIARAAAALGIATADDLRDYYRLPTADMAQPITDLVEEGTLTPVRVRGWQPQAYLHRDARAGRRISGTTLISPFDSLIWHRPRTERLFDFRYRLEIYTPADKRQHGYYVLPLLVDGVFVARVDLKADRAAGTLLVQRVHFEDGARHETGAHLLAAVADLARWLSLSRVAIAPAAASDDRLSGLEVPTP